MAPKRKTASSPTQPERSVWPKLVKLARWLLALAIVATLGLFGFDPVDRPALAPRQGPPIADARSWGYQLQNLALKSIADGIDVLVVDYSRDGSDRRVLGSAEIDVLRTRADGSKRIILAYMSIGEAENYRYYWRSGWQPGKPSWLGQENPEWRGNFPVRFWEPGWRRIIMQPRTTLIDRLLDALQPARRAYLDRIIEAGFDGVYLDRIDAFETWSKERPSAQKDMIEFVRALSTYARQRRPGFLIVPQNGEELLRNVEYRRAIDGIGKEDLLFGIKGDGQPNAEDEIQSGIADLGHLKAEGRPVFVVEYLADPLKRAVVQKRLATLGFVVQFARRDLKQIPE